MSVGGNANSLVAGRGVKFHPVGIHAIDLHPVVDSTALPKTETSPVVLAQISRCRHRRTMILFGFDESGSVTSHNDPSRPIAGRHREALQAIDLLGSCRCGSELGAILFFPPGSHDVGPIPLNRHGQRALRDAIANRPSATSSCLDEVLDAAYDLAAAHPDHDVTLIILSDFEIFDPDPDETLERFRLFPGRRHAVVLQAAVPRCLDVDPNVVVSRIAWDSQPGEVARAIAAALAETRTS